MESLFVALYVGLQDDVSAPSEALRRAGAITFAVGVGSLDASELNDISGSEDRTFVVADFTDLSGVVLEEIQEAICVGKKCSETYCFKTRYFYQVFHKYL